MHYRIGFFIILLGLASCDGFQGDSNPYRDVEITFSEHIAPIVYENCTPCHRPGEAGPFKLISHHDLAKRSKMIKEVVETRYMPPWPADKNYSTFLNEWGLDENEIQLIQAWVDQGAPIGDENKIPPSHISQRVRCWVNPIWCWI